MSHRRAYFEHAALIKQRECCAAHTPEVYHFDRGLALIVMECATVHPPPLPLGPLIQRCHARLGFGVRYIAPPHQILRKTLIDAAESYANMGWAPDMARFCAHTLFKTSDLRE